MRGVTVLAAVALGAVYSVDAFGQGAAGCGQIRGMGYGPYDYRTASREVKQMVEPVHFTPDVEYLRKGSTGPIAGDINYTLIVFPNHARALLAMSKLTTRLQNPQPQGARFSIDCYFDRAIRWTPDDPNVRLVYSIHLLRNGQKDAAREQLKVAEQSPVGDANFHYNLGLVFLDVGDADRALTHAWRAYAQGYELPGLRSRLEKLGKWREPEKDPATK